MIDKEIGGEGWAIGKPAPQISAAFSYLGVDSRGAEGETGRGRGEGTAAFFNFWRANSPPYHCVRGEAIGDSQRRALKQSDPYLGAQKHTHTHTHAHTHTRTHTHTHTQSRFYRGFNQVHHRHTWHMHTSKRNSCMHTNAYDTQSLHYRFCPAPRRIHTGTTHINAQFPSKSFSIIHGLPVENYIIFLFIFQRVHMSHVISWYSLL